MFPKSILIATLIATINAHSPYEDCGPNGENCFAVPPFESDVATCLAAQNCEAVVAFVREGNGIRFELEADLRFDNTWVGVGLSADGAQAMGDDAVVACYGNTVANYWNAGSPIFYSFPLDDATNGLSDVFVEESDGKIHCHFTRDAVTHLMLPLDFGEADIDLDNNAYYVELASGPLDASGFIGPHQGAKVSDEPRKM